MLRAIKSISRKYGNIWFVMCQNVHAHRFDIDGLLDTIGQWNELCEKIGGSRFTFSNVVSDIDNELRLAQQHEKKYKLSMKID